MLTAGPAEQIGRALLEEERAERIALLLAWSRHLDEEVVTLEDFEERQP